MSAKKINIRIGGKSLGKRKASGHKPYSCDLCGKTFKAKASVRRHMKTHSSVKEFQCEYCSKGFHQKSNLMAHIRLHTGATASRAPTQHNAPFRVPDNSATAVTGERPFLCNACGGRFSYIAALQRHTRVCGSAAASQAPVYSRIESVSSINSHIEPISQPSHTDSTDVSDTDTQGSVRMNYGSVVRATAPVSTPPFQSLYPNPTLRVPSAPSTFRGVDFTPARGVSALPSASMSRMSWGANSHDSFAPVNTHLRLPTDEKQGFCVQKLNIGDSRSIYAYMKIEVPPGCATLDGIEPVPTADYAAFMYVPPTVSEIEPTYAPLRRVQSGTWLSPSNQQSVSVGVSAAASALAASSFEPSQPLPELTMGRVSSDPWQFTPAFGTTQ